MRVLMGMMLGCALLATAAATEGSTTELPVGDGVIRFDVPAGYARATEHASALFRVTAASLPTDRRLVESFYLYDDLATMETGKPIPGIYYQFQVDTGMEPLRFDEAGWQPRRRALVAALAAFDAEAERREADAANARMSHAFGRPMTVAREVVAAPVVYYDRPDGVRYHQTVTSQHDIDGITAQTRVVTAVGTVLLANREVSLHVNGHDTGPESLPAVRAALDSALANLVALNPSPTLPPGSGADAAGAARGEAGGRGGSRWLFWLVLAAAGLGLIWWWRR